MGQKITGLFIVAVFGLGWASGCNPVYAPPARAGHGLAPGSAEGGDVILAGSLLGAADQRIGHLNIGKAVSDIVTLEAGSSTTSNGFAMAYLGGRLTPFPAGFPRRRVKFLWDLEGGGGVGAGGDNCPGDAGAEEESQLEYPDRHCDGDSWTERLAGGGYLGTGIGMNIKWLDLFFRARVQLTSARAVPGTFWYTVGLGQQFRIGEAFKVFQEVGRFGYKNDADSLHGWYFELGAGLTFDLTKASRAGD